MHDKETSFGNSGKKLNQIPKSQNSPLKTPKQQDVYFLKTQNKRRNISNVSLYKLPKSLSYIHHSSYIMFSETVSYKIKEKEC